MANERYNSFDIEEIAFKTDVPHGIKFYSAHFKVDAFRHIGSLNVNYAALCDIDVVCLRSAPKILAHIIEKNIPLVYEISDQVIPAYGHDVIIKDIEEITCEKSEGRWIGGEFISGPPSFFAMLAKEIDGLLPRYFSRIEKMHHVGDEAYTSSAIEKIRRRGTYVGDAGLLGIVGRYWNASNLHPQKPFAYFKNCFLLHLPADKKLLAKLGMGEFCLQNSNEFIELYEKNIRKTRLKQFLVSNLKPHVFLILKRLALPNAE